jgi:hypothetical protein
MMCQHLPFLKRCLCCHQHVLYCQIITAKKERPRADAVARGAKTAIRVLPHIRVGLIYTPDRKRLNSPPITVRRGARLLHWDGNAERPFLHRHRHSSIFPTLHKRQGHRSARPQSGPPDNHAAQGEPLRRVHCAVYRLLDRRFGLAFERRFTRCSVTVVRGCFRTYSRDTNRPSTADRSNVISVATAIGSFLRLVVLHGSRRAMPSNHSGTRSSNILTQFCRVVF